MASPLCTLWDLGLQQEREHMIGLAAGEPYETRAEGHSFMVSGKEPRLHRKAGNHADTPCGMQIT